MFQSCAAASSRIAERPTYISIIPVLYAYRYAVQVLVAKSAMNEQKHRTPNAEEVSFLVSHKKEAARLSLNGVIQTALTMTPSDNTIETRIVNDSAACARKRRIELRNMQRSVKNEEDLIEVSDAKRARLEESQLDPVTSKPKPSITGIKHQHRYDPGVKLSRDELKTWRKEARRVRNRESAAASRKRNRERIDELESEVDVLHSKYTAALQRIIELEAASTVNDSFTPAVLRQDLYELSTTGMRPASPGAEPIKTVSPPMSPSIASRRVSDVDLHAENVNKKYHHIMEMISRPAVST